MVRIGLIGCGTIGTQLALALQREHADVARLVALCDRDPARALALQRRLKASPPIVSLSILIRRCQLVLEAASGDAACEVVRRALHAGRDVFVMSAGGLLGDQSWRRLAARSAGRIHIPSGALAGLDGVKAMAAGVIRRVQLTTRKPPAALLSAPYVVRRGLRLERLRAPRLIFQGSADQAVKAFPRNANIAAALTLASGLPAARVRVRIIADPSRLTNRHELDIEGDGTRLACSIESRASANPQTSELAVRSARAMLARLFQPVVIGT